MMIMPGTIHNYEKFVCTIIRDFVLFVIYNM
jgi:hypothetical protein